MDYGPYYVPPSVAPILANAAAVQVPLISQPKGFAGALPGINTAVQGGFDAATAQQKKKSVLEAQQFLSSYIAKKNTGQPTTPEEDNQAVQSQFSLGMSPTMPDANKMAMQKMELERGNAQTKLYNTESDVKKNPPPKPTPTAFPPAAIDAWVKKLTTKNPQTGQPYAVLSDIPGGMSANSLRAQVATKLASVPGYDVGSGVAGRRFQTGEAAFASSAGVEQPIMLAKSIIPALDRLQQSYNKLDFGTIPIINRAKLAALKASGDARTPAYAQDITDVADQFAKIIQGGGTGNATTDAKLNQAVAMFDKGASPKQMLATINEAKALLNIRLNEYQKFQGKFNGQSQGNTGTVQGQSGGMSSADIVNKYGVP